MSKLKWFILIVVLILVVGQPLIYLAVPDTRPALSDFWGGIQQSASVIYLSAADAFMGLPYWQYIGVGILLLVGYIFGHHAQVWWLRIKTSGIWGYGQTNRPLEQLPPLQKAPVNTMPKQIYPNPDLPQPTQQLEEQTT